MPPLPLEIASAGMFLKPKAVAPGPLMRRVGEGRVRAVVAEPERVDQRRGNGPGPGRAVAVVAVELATLIVRAVGGPIEERVAVDVLAEETPAE